ncbi:MAG: ABC transporter permease, partial [Saprospiraceae bacterium]|nr:ABC transporter permease [Saprospiraceae bacterium]
IIGGILGLGIVYLITNMLSAVLPFAIYLSLDNVIWGVVLSVGIGVLSGLIPAYQAARMDPVEA